jgi:hypothetical protein
VGRRAVLDTVVKRKIPSPRRVGEKSNAHKILVGKPEGRKPLGRPRHRWEDNIIMDLR